MASESDTRLQTIVWALGLRQDEIEALRHYDPDRYVDALIWRQGASWNLSREDSVEEWELNLSMLLRCDPNGVPYAPFTDGQLHQFETNRRGNEYFLVAWWEAAAHMYALSTDYAIQENNAIATARNATNLALSYLAAGRAEHAAQLVGHVQGFTALSQLGSEIRSIKREALTIQRMSLAAQGNEESASITAPWLEHYSPELKRLDPQVRRDVSNAWRRVGDEYQARKWEDLYDTVARLS